MTRKLGKAVVLAADGAVDDGADGIPALDRSASLLGEPKSGVMCLYCRHWLRRRDTDEARFRQSLSADPTPLKSPKRSDNSESPGELGRDGGLEKSSYCAMAMLYRRDETRARGSTSGPSIEGCRMSETMSESQSGTLGRPRAVGDSPVDLPQNAPKHSQFLGIWVSPVQQLPQLGHATGRSMGVKITDLEQKRL